jgi:hypothetical protein
MASTVWLPLGVTLSHVSAWSTVYTPDFRTTSLPSAEVKWTGSSKVIVVSAQVKRGGRSKKAKLTKTNTLEKMQCLGFPINSSLENQKFHENENVTNRIF